MSMSTEPEKKTDDLAQKLKSHLANTGTLSAADLATFDRAAKEAEASANPPGAELNEDSESEAEDPAEHDGVNKMAGEPGPPKDALHDRVSNLGEATEAEKARVRLTITAADKEAFVSAAVNNSRMVTHFALLGGKLRLSVRNRTIPESRAIIAQIRRELESTPDMTNLDYTVRLRSMLMAAQVEELAGVTQPTLDSFTPLRPTQNGERIDEPGWLQQADHWSNINEGTHGLIWQCIWEFETKYWTMVEESKHQDFWLPEASS